MCIILPWRSAVSRWAERVAFSCTSPWADLCFDVVVPWRRRWFSFFPSSWEQLLLMALVTLFPAEFSLNHFIPVTTPFIYLFLNKCSLGFWALGVCGLNMFKLPELVNKSTKFTFPWSSHPLTNGIKHSLHVHMKILYNQTSPLAR